MTLQSRSRPVWARGLKPMRCSVGCSVLDRVKLCLTSYATKGMSLWSVWRQKNESQAPGSEKVQAGAFPILSGGIFAVSATAAV